MLQAFQRTIAKPIVATGVGLHSGLKVQMTLRPADIGCGIVFHRVDLPGSDPVPARAGLITDTRLASVLQVGVARVSTVEHLMSACAGLGIDNLHVDLSAEEVPIMDGSASTFAYLLSSAGIVEQLAPRRYIRVLQSIEVSEGVASRRKWARLVPHPSFRVRFSIDFQHPAIDTSGKFIDIDFASRSYDREIARARTFGFVQDVEGLRAQGLARGGCLDNAIVLDEYRVLNNDGLRYPDEFVRHKVLDAIGDLYLLGAPLLASYEADKSGHGLNNQLARALMQQPEAWEWAELAAADAPQAAATPGLPNRPQAAFG